MKFMAEGLSKFPVNLWERTVESDTLRSDVFDELLTGNPYSPTGSEDSPDKTGRSHSKGITCGILNTMQTFKKCGSKIYCVSKEMLDVAERTDSLNHIYGRDIKKPYPAFAFWLPRRSGVSTFHICCFNDVDPDEGLFLKVDTIGSSQVKGAKFYNDTKTLSNKPRRAFTLVSWDPMAGDGEGILTAAVSPLYDDLPLIDSMTSDQPRFSEIAPGIKKAALYADLETVTEAAESVDRSGESARHLYGSIDEERRAGIVSSDSRDSDCLLMLSNHNLCYQLISVITNYPEYVLKREVKCKVSKADGNSKKKKKSVIRTISFDEVRTPTGFEELPTPVKSKGNSQKTGSLKTHWRKGHWRRQRHSLAWELNNPSTSSSQTPEGTRYHLSWIRPCLVSKSEGGAQVKVE